MRLFLWTILLFTVALTSASGQTKSMKWEDTARDVYIDGQIDRDAQVLYPDHGKQLVLFSAKLKQAVVLDTDAGTVSVIDKDTFKFAPDRASAKAAEGMSPKSAGKYTKINDSIYNFAVDGKTVLINRHEGALGEITEEKLWETVPVWKSLLDNYRPNPESVAALKNINEDTQLIVVLGTWCHDSKDHVPPLLKAVQVANNKKIHVKLVALDRGFTKSTADLRRYQITNTPTFIVERNGHELGRIIETPAVPAIEDDLVAILNGKPNVHHGTAEHGEQLAEGRYQYTDREGKETGTEHWQLYSTNAGGRLVHSEIVQGDLRTEVYYETDSKNHPVFIETTVRRGDRIIRERSYAEKNELFSHLTGDDGVLDQRISFQESSAFSSPAIASAGWITRLNIKSGEPISVYRGLSEFNNIGGFIENVSYESKGQQPVHAPAGDFDTQLFVQTAKKDRSEWFIHPQLGIPVIVDLHTEGKINLTSLKTSAVNK